MKLFNYFFVNVRIRFPVLRYRTKRHYTRLSVKSTQAKEFSSQLENQCEFEQIYHEKITAEKIKIKNKNKSKIF